MLHKGLGGMAALAFAASATSLVGALQGSDTSSGTSGLWIAAAVFLAIGIACSIGWLMTREDIAAPAPAGQIVSQGGTNQQNAQQTTGANSGLIVGRDLFVGGSQDAPPRKPSEWFEGNSNPTYGQVIGPIWWQLMRWRFNKWSDVPSLVIAPHCVDHDGLELLIRRDRTWELERTAGVGPSEHANSRHLYCRETASAHEIELDDFWPNVYASALTHIERKARREGWRNGPPSDQRYVGASEGPTGASEVSHG